MFSRAFSDEKLTVWEAGHNRTLWVHASDDATTDVAMGSGPSNTWARVPSLASKYCNPCINKTGTLIFRNSAMDSAAPLRVGFGKIEASTTLFVARYAFLALPRPD